MKCGIGYDFEENKISYQGEYLNGKRNGIGTNEYANDAFYIGEWKDDLKHGYVIK